MDETKTIKCSKCCKAFKLKILRFPAKMEETRSWDTHYFCPYCNEAYEIHLDSSEEVMTFKLDE